MSVEANIKGQKCIGEEPGLAEGKWLVVTFVCNFVLALAVESDRPLRKGLEFFVSVCFLLLGHWIIRGKERERAEQCSLIGNFLQMQIPNLLMGILIDFYKTTYTLCLTVKNKPYNSQVLPLPHN